MIKTKKLKRFDRSWTISRTRNIPLYYINKSKYSDEFIDEFFDYCLMWCVKKFGRARDISPPDIEWQWQWSDKTSRRFMAFYHTGNPGLITIKLRGHRTFYNLAESVLHEYVHYMQPAKGNWYDRYHSKYGYNSNPYEIEANYLSELYAADCISWVVEQMKSSINKL